MSLLLQNIATCMQIFKQISIHQKMSRVTSPKASYINFVYKEIYNSRKKGKSLFACIKYVTSELSVQ